MPFRLVLLALAIAGCSPAASPTPILVSSGPPLPTAAPSHAQARARASAEPVDRDAAGCDAGDKEACLSLVFRCRPGGASNDVPFESPACADRDRKACDAGVSSSCKRLADRYWSEPATLGVPHDKTRAVALYERACAAEDLNSCFMAANAFDTGTGVPRDAARAVSALERACPGDQGMVPQACTLLGDHLASGQGTGKDEARAARLYLTACCEGVCDDGKLKQLCADAGGSSRTRAGCVPLAQLAAVRVAGVPPQSGSRALSLLDRACKRGEPEGCSTLASWYADGVTLSGDVAVKKDAVRAAVFRTRACAAGDKTACAQP